MRVKEYLVSKAARLFGFGVISEYIYAFLSIGYPSGEALPKVLMDFNLLNVIRGLFTRFVVSTNLDWIWPFWIERQFYPKYKDFSARGFNPASINTSHRNWTGIGCLDSEYESIIDPRGLLTPYNNSWSLDCWIQLDGHTYAPAKLDNVKQSLLNNLPIVITEFTVQNKISVKLTAFISEEAGNSSNAYQKVEVKNIGKTRLNNAYFAFAFRPYNPEGIVLINQLHFNEKDQVLINNKLAAIFMQTPDGITTSGLSKGDVYNFFDEAKNSRIFNHRTSRVGMATGIGVYKLNLNPEQATTYEVRLPNNPKVINKLTMPKKIEEYSKLLRQNSYENILNNQISAWESKINDGLLISVPDKRIQNCFEANKAFMLMFYDNTYITPGPSTYHDFWFRDAAYLLNGLDKMGYHRETKNILDTYKTRIHATGFFYSQAGEWDSNGQAIWSIMEHYRLTRNEEFLKENYPIINRGARWIINKAQNNLKLDAGYRGIMPPGLSAEHFGLNDYYYWDDFWCLTGLRDAILASQILGKNAKNFESGYQKLSDNLDISLQYVESKLGTPIMSISPSRRMDSAAVGCLASYYPCRIFKPTDIRLVNTVNYMRENNFLGDGFFHDVNHSGYGTYLTMHFIQCYFGLRERAKAHVVLDWVLAAASATWCWPEAIHPRTMGGTIGDGHHGWAAADFTLVVRNMLFMEEGNTLTLTPGAPKEWFKKGKVISVKKGPTYFGKLNYEISCSDNIVTLKMDNKFFKNPEKIEWSLPMIPAKVTINGKTTAGNDYKVIFSAKVKEVKLTLK